MSLSSPKIWLERAQREHFAVGAFNANTLEQIQAVVLAAQAENAPAMIQISHRALQYLGSGSEMPGLEYAAALSKVAAQSVSVPIVLHLDHALEDEVRQAMRVRFTSVMFDGSLLPLAENIETTRRLSLEARAAGICLEAEVGKVPKPGVSDDSEELTDPTEAATFVAATGINTLAVAIGSVHGLTEKKVSLDRERLKAIRDLVSVPLVLHGSSGVKDDEIAEGIRLGLCKVNVATQLNKAFTGAARSALEHDADMVDPRKYLGPARAAMIEAVRERIRFFGSSGKAA